MKRIMRYIYNLLFFCLFFSFAAIAQTHKVSGKVIDQNGNGIPAASVVIKGTQTGAIADGNGVFNIDIAPGDVLVISANGYTNNQIKITAKSDLSVISLAKSNKIMEEVVVTALGQTQKKAKVGYSTATFNSAIINKQGATSMLQSLEGKVAGAEISDLGGPGSSTKVILRGYGIISGGDNQPLYVIDGVPLSDGSFLANSGTGTSGASNTDAVDFGNGMNNVNPNDIESITVLKGTAASSLYGSLAKNGAIIITTKRGKSGAVKVEYDGSIALSRVGKLPTYQTEFGQGWGGDYVSDENGSWGPAYDGKMRKWGSIVSIDGVDSQLSKPYLPIPNNLRNFFVTGTEFNNGVSVSGGGDATRYYFSYSNVSSDGVVPDNANTQERNNFSLRTNSTFDKFYINSSFNYVNQNVTSPPTGQETASGGGTFLNLLQIPADLPITQFQNINNPFFNESNYFNPYAENPYFTIQQDGDKQGLNRFFGNVDLGYKFTPHFSIEYRLGGDFSNFNTFIYKQPASALPNTWDGNPATNPEDESRVPDVGEVGIGSQYIGLLNSDLIVNFNKELSKNFTLDGLAGGNYYQTNSSQVFTSVSYLFAPNFFNLSNTSKIPETFNAASDEKKIGVYAQATLGYKDQLYLTGNARNDWSSTLPINNSSIFYSGANISWLASQLFTSKNTVSFLKLRFAYGKTGSDPAPYNVNQTLGNGSVALNPLGTLTFPFNGVGGYGTNSTLFNPNLKPIFTTEEEAGAEVRFFKDRIGLDATVYNKVTNDQIFAVLVAPSTGYTNQVENLGQVTNKGIELTLNVRAVQNRNFSWDINYTFARNWNIVDNLNGTSPDPLLAGNGSFEDAEMRAVVGKTVASIYSSVPQRSPTGQIVVNEQTGLPLNNTTPLDQFGLTKGYFGTALYTYTMGLSNTFTYKDFSLSGSFDFRYGGVMYSETADLSMFVGNSVVTTYNNRQPFIIPNSVYASTNASGQTVYVPNTTQVGGATNNIPAQFIGVGAINETNQVYNYYSEGSSFSGGASAMRIISRSFLKLRDINLAYNLPKKVMSKIKGASGSIGIFGRNFLLWTPKSNVFVDPEATNLGNDLTGEVGEFAGIPLTKSYGLILKVIF